MSEILHDPRDGQGSEPKSPSQPASIPPVPGRWRMFLLASLALNLLFAGAAAGSLWHTKRHRGFAGNTHGTSDFAIPGFVKSLPKDRAKELRRLIKEQNRPDLTPLTAAVRQARRQAAATLAAPAFDREKLTAAFSAIDTAEAASKAAARSTLIAVAEQLTPQERQALAERWKTRRPHMFEDGPPRAKAPQIESR